MTTANDAITQLLAAAKVKGSVTFDQINTVVALDTPIDQLERVLECLAELGVTIIDEDDAATEITSHK